MRTAGKVVVIALVLGIALAASAQAAQFNWQQFKGTQLRVLLNKHPWQAGIEPHLKDFEALTGIKLITEVYPEDQFRAKTLVELTSGASSMDVLMSMPAQEGLKYMRAGWLQPVDEFLKDSSITAPDYNWNDFLSKTRDAMTIEGKLVGPPIQVENVSLMYRKDVFQKYNVKVPTTLDELEAAAKALNGKAMTDDGQPGFGITLRGKRAAATSMWAGMLYAFGGSWLTPSREPAVNSEESIKAIDLWGRLLRLYGPPGSENNHWYEASSIFSQGKAAMYLDANSLWVVVEDPQKSKVINKVGYALFPKGPKGQPGSTVAVWGLAMPKTSKNQKAAWLFMQWATNKDQVFKVQTEKGVLGCRESVWTDPKGKAKVPADLAESLTQGSKIGTPFWNPPVVAVAEVRDAVGAAIVTSIQGGDVKAAANKAAADMKRIMAETEK
ncbi:MAG TPA: sugar ABC transporter substrate-binding protein [Candidatus Sulfotelmatobacter sp.]|nr:sugar ABC transporter substrate-binding protein [Candidatus Sulfotelmatobacter sp.]